MAFVEVVSSNNSLCRCLCTDKYALAFLFPEGNHQQTAVSYGSQAPTHGTANVRVRVKVAPDASKLTERAKAAEYAAAVAQAEAERLNQLAKAAEEAARTTWDAMTPNVHGYHEADAHYNAVTLEYSHKKASYDAAVLSINDATKLIFAKDADLKDAKARIKKAEAKINEYQTQLNTILVIANYAAGVAKFIKENTYFSTTVQTEPTAASTAASTVPTTTPMPESTSAAASTPLTATELLRELQRLQGKYTLYGACVAL